MNIYDISQLAGVSIATVSRVINGSDRVSEHAAEGAARHRGKRLYAQRLCARSGVEYDAHRRPALRGQLDPYLAQAVYNLEQELRLNGYDCLLCCTGYARKPRKNIWIFC